MIKRRRSELLGVSRFPCLQESLAAGTFLVCHRGTWDAPQLGSVLALCCCKTPGLLLIPAFPIAQSHDFPYPKFPLPDRVSPNPSLFPALPSRLCCRRRKQISFSRPPIPETRPPHLRVIPGPRAAPLVSLQRFIPACRKDSAQPAHTPRIWGNWEQQSESAPQGPSPASHCCLGSITRARAELAPSRPLLASLAARPRRS